MTFHAFGKDHGMETPYIESSYDADMHGETLSSADAAIAAEHSALQDPLVLAARAFEYDEQVLLAVLTEPIYLSSDRAALKALLIKNAEAATGKKVLLSFDLEVYRRIARDMPEEAKALLMKKAAPQNLRQ